jgi:hypothetical protein
MALVPKFNPSCGDMVWYCVLWLWRGVIVVICYWSLAISSDCFSMLVPFRHLTRLPPSLQTISGFKSLSIWSLNLKTHFTLDSVIGRGFFHGLWYGFCGYFLSTPNNNFVSGFVGWSWSVFSSLFLVLISMMKWTLEVVVFLGHGLATLTIRQVWTLLGAMLNISFVSMKKGMKPTSWLFNRSWPNLEIWIKLSPILYNV